MLPWELLANLSACCEGEIKHQVILKLTLLSSPGRSCPSNPCSSWNSGAAAELLFSSSLILGSQCLVLLGSTVCLFLPPWGGQGAGSPNTCSPTYPVLWPLWGIFPFPELCKALSECWLFRLNKHLQPIHPHLGADSSCAAHQSRPSNKVMFERGWKPVCACQPPSSWQETWAIPQTKWDGFRIYFFLLCLWKGE